MYRWHCGRVVSVVTSRCSGTIHSAAVTAAGESSKRLPVGPVRLRVIAVLFTRIKVVMACAAHNVVTMRWRREEKIVEFGGMSGTRRPEGTAAAPSLPRMAAWAALIDPCFGQSSGAG